METEFDILKLVIERLEKSRIPYMLTGSFAGNFYTVPRMTRDIDIVIDLLQPSVDQLLEVFKDDFYVSKEAIIQAIEHPGMFNIIHTNTVLKIDFIIQKKSAFRNTEFQRRKRVKFGDLDIWIVSVEDLILSKLIWAKETLSNIQLKDIQNLLKDTKSLNASYLQEWIQSLQLDQIYAKARSHE